MAYFRSNSQVRFIDDDTGAFDLYGVWQSATAVDLMEDVGVQFWRKDYSWSEDKTVVFDDALTITYDLGDGPRALSFYGWNIALDGDGVPVSGTVGGIIERVATGDEWKIAWKLFTGTPEDAGPTLDVLDVVVAWQTESLDDDLALIEAGLSSVPTHDYSVIRLSKFDDVVTGGVGDDIVYAREGNDRVLGGAGDDYVVGNGGNDRLIGGLGNDDLNGGVGNDVLRGQDGHDLLWGGAGANRLFGGSGADSFFAGNGPEKMFVGNDDDVDTFYYTRPGQSRPGLDTRDKIFGFEHGVDKIELYLVPPGDGLFDWFATYPDWSDDGPAEDSLWIKGKGDNVVLYYDSTGDAQADLSILFVGVGTLDYGDITFYDV